jgi:hypothetical protein
MQILLRYSNGLLEWGRSICIYASRAGKSAVTIKAAKGRVTNKQTGQFCLIKTARRSDMNASRLPFLE